MWEGESEVGFISVIFQQSELYALFEPSLPKTSLLFGHIPTLRNGWESWHSSQLNINQVNMGSCLAALTKNLFICAKLVTLIICEQTLASLSASISRYKNLLLLDKKQPNRIRRHILSSTLVYMPLEYPFQHSAWPYSSSLRCIQSKSSAERWRKNRPNTVQVNKRRPKVEGSKKRKQHMGPQVNKVQHRCLSGMERASGTFHNWYGVGHLSVKVSISAWFMLHCFLKH